MGNAAGRDRIFQGVGDMLLPDQILKTHRAVTAGDDGVIGRRIGQGNSHPSKVVCLMKSQAMGNGCGHPHQKRSLGKIVGKTKKKRGRVAAPEEDHPLRKVRSLMAAPSGLTRFKTFLRVGPLPAPRRGQKAPSVARMGRPVRVWEESHPDLPFPQPPGESRRAFQGSSYQAAHPPRR